MVTYLYNLSMVVTHYYEASGFCVYWTHFVIVVDNWLPWCDVCRGVALVLSRGVVLLLRVLSHLNFCFSVCFSIDSRQCMGEMQWATWC